MERSKHVFFVGEGADAFARDVLRAIGRGDCQILGRFAGVHANLVITMITPRDAAYAE